MFALTADPTATPLPCRTQKEMSAPVPSARKVVKKTVTAEDGRKNRLASAVQLRKEKRDEGIAKKRNANATATETLSLADTAPEIVRVEDLPRFAAGERAECAHDGLEHAWTLKRAARGRRGRKRSSAFVSAVPV